MIKIIGDYLYQPKGGLCANCKDSFKDCSNLPFNEMRVIEQFNGIKIVYCSSYRNIKS